MTMQIGMSVISNIILGGITGAIMNTLSMIRTILCYKDKLGIKEKRCQKGVLYLIINLILENERKLL